MNKIKPMLVPEKEIINQDLMDLIFSGLFAVSLILLFCDVIVMLA